MQVIDFKLPLPPLLSALFTNRHGKSEKTGKKFVSRVSSSKYTAWTKEAIAELKAQGKHRKLTVTKPECVRVLYVVNSDFYTKKDGSIRVVDVANFEKAISDIIPEVIKNFDDSQIFDFRMIKNHTRKEKSVEVYLTEIDASDIDGMLHSLRSNASDFLQT